MSILPPIPPRITVRMSNLLLIQTASPVASDRGFAQQITKENKMEYANKFSFNNALLKSVNDRGNFLTGQVQSRQTERTPDGNIRSRFIASRQVTIYDPALVTLLRQAITETSEVPVNCSGYMTTTVREDKGQTKWYDNQIVTELELI